MIQALTIDAILAATRTTVKSYKFVKVSGEYRFIEVAFYGPAHRDLVSEDEEPQAAGTIMLAPDYWRMSDWYSSTLRIGCSGEEETELQQLIDRTPHSEIVMRKYEEEQRQRQAR